MTWADVIPTLIGVVPATVFLLVIRSILKPHKDN